MDAARTSSRPTLLALPLEMREEIYSSLLVPRHIYTSDPAPETRFLQQRTRPVVYHVDTRIALPVCFPLNLHQTCRQLREECLQFHARRLNSLLPPVSTNPMPDKDVASFQLAQRSNKGDEELVERFHDSNTARITLEILIGACTNTGFHVPARRTLSPCFFSLIPLLSRLTKIHFTIWAGYSWWSGESTRPISQGMTRRARVKRSLLDQNDQAPDPSATNVTGREPQALRPDPLATALDVVLEHLPLVKEVSIDLLVHILDLSNWDLPEENRLKGIDGWLAGPISPKAGQQMEKVERRVRVARCADNTRVTAATVLRQRELLHTERNLVHVERGDNLMQDWDRFWDEPDTIEEPSLTERYDRVN